MMADLARYLSVWVSAGTYHAVVGELEHERLRTRAHLQHESGLGQQRTYPLRRRGVHAQRLGLKLVPVLQIHHARRTTLRRLLSQHPRQVPGVQDDGRDRGRCCALTQAFAALLHETIAQNKLSGSRVKAVTESATRALVVRRLADPGPAQPRQGHGARAPAQRAQNQARVAVHL